LFVAFTGKKQPKQVHFFTKFRQNAQISKSRVLASGFFMKSLSRSFNQVLVSKVMVLTTSLSTPHKENAPWKQALHSHIFWNLFHVELYTSLSQGCTFCHPLQLLLSWRRNVVTIVNSTQLSLKWTWTINIYVCGSLNVLVEQNSLLKSFVPILFWTSAIRNPFSFHQLPNSILRALSTNKSKFKNNQRPDQHHRWKNK